MEKKFKFGIILFIVAIIYMLMNQIYNLFLMYPTRNYFLVGNILVIIFLGVGLYLLFQRKKSCKKYFAIGICLLVLKKILFSGTEGEILISAIYLIILAYIYSGKKPIEKLIIETSPLKKKDKIIIGSIGGIFIVSLLINFFPDVHWGSLLFLAVILGLIYEWIIVPLTNKKN